MPQIEIPLSNKIKVRKKDREPYFIGDPHFLHGNIIGHCSRPFKDSSEQTKVIANNWNNTIGEKDDVFILGDLFYRGKASAIHHILSRLNGHKTLIMGNHDYKWIRPEFTQYFERIDKQLFIQVYDYDEDSYQDIFLSHYPCLAWPNAFHGSWALYGHVHGRLDDLEDSGPILDVGVDSHNFFPIPYSTVKILINDKINSS